MKKFTFVLIVLFGFLTTVRAQSYVCDLQNRWISSIPSSYTQSDQRYLYVIEGNVHHVYDEDFTYIGDVPTANHLIIAVYEDVDLGFGGEGYYCTQTLFNSDAFFEYIDVSDDGTEVYVKSSNGSIVSSIHTDPGYHVFTDEFMYTIIKINNKNYMLFGEYTDNKEWRYLVYYISQSQGLTKVDTPLPISAFPTMPTRDQQITVELGEDANVTEIKVINSIGQELKCIPIEKDQRSVTIPASELGIGLNVLNARNGHSQGSCKIIVK